MNHTKTLTRLGIIFAGAALSLSVFQTSSMDARAARARSADDLLVVDCLLPGQIRKLGRITNYLTPRRPIKTTVQDCEIRGGEYVAYDRADYRTALNVWLPRANEGDPEAQTYVGEIYEKGLGLAPDYQVAAMWYQRAAEAKHTRAQINLGHLYEKGLGVPKNPAAALAWYRKASGLSEGIVLDPGTINAQQQELETLRKELVQRKKESDFLRRQLEDTRRQKEHAQQELERRKAEFDAERRRLEQARMELRQQKEQAKAKEADRIARKEAELQQREAALGMRQQEIARLRQEITRVETEAGRYQGQLASLSEGKQQELQTLKDEVERHKVETGALQQHLGETQKQVANARQHLERQRAEAEAQRRRLEQSQKVLQEYEQKQTADVQELTRLQKLAKQRETEVARQRTETDRLRQEVHRVEEEADHYRIKLAEVQNREKATVQVALAGPSIEMIDPSLTITRGVATVKVRSSVMQRQIVGRVSAPAGVLTLLINDRPEEPNQQGVFQTQVTMESLRTPVQIVVIDQQGKRATVKFTLESETRQAGSKPAPSPTPIAKKVSRVNFGPYYALVIGNNKFAYLPKLDMAVNDARAVADTLRHKYGFKTTTLINATRYEILSALNKLRENLTKNDNLLIYYAGHGELDEVNMRGHWLPVDAEPENSANWISNVAITDILNAMAAKQILVVSDSCYSGALTRSALARLKVGLTEKERLNWLKTMSRKRSRTVLTSGGLKPVMDAGGGKHSVFARAFLEVLNANEDIIEGQRLYREVAARVAYAASTVRFEQVPEYAPIRHAGHEAGDFFLIPKS